MKVCTYLALVAVCVTLTSCNAVEGRKRGCVGFPSADCAQIAARLDRADWMVSQQSKIWKVRVGQPLLSEPPRHVGYLTERRYRKSRGGPVFEMYTVTSLNRDEQLGHIDSMGRAVRYEARRNVGFEEVPVGVGTLENSVGAILDTMERITLEPTTERRIAFEELDDDGDGRLTWGPWGDDPRPDEISRFGDRIIAADRNRDGFVDFEEFSTIETL